MTPEIEQAIAASPFTALGLVGSARSRRARGGVHAALPRPGRGRAARARRARRPRGRPDGHRQDGRVRAPDPPAPLGRRPRRAAHPRAVLTPTRELAAQIADRVARLRAPPAPPPRGRLRRRQPASQEIALRAAPDLARRDPRPPARPMQQRLVRLDGVDALRPRRGRPHARHGVRPRRAPGRRRAPGGAQTLFFSATIRRSDRDARAHDARQPGARLDHADGHARPRASSSRWIFVDKADKRALLERLLARRDRASARSSSRGPSTARTASPSSSIAPASARRHPRQQDAGSARARPRGVPPRHDPRARRDGRRGARDRRRRHLARRQLRPAERRRELRAPHRPHGPRGRERARRSRSATARSARSSSTSSA